MDTAQEKEHVYFENQFCEQVNSDFNGDKNHGHLREELGRKQDLER